MTDIIATILIILLLLIISAFLSGSETALTAASRARMLQLQREGSHRARWVIDLLEHKERLLSAILLGNNMVNIFASVLATQLFLTLMGESGIFYATIIMTALVVIFAEILPKTYAISTPDTTALRASTILRVLVTILAPITIALTFISRRILRLLNLSGGDDAFGGAHDELRGAIDLHHEEGGVRKGERDMLGGILDLRETYLEEIMVHRKSMQMIDADTPPADIIKQVLGSPYTRIPLWRGETDNIIGVLHAKDLLPALASTQDLTQLDIVALAHEAWFVPETTSLREQLNAFRRRQAHFALVVDEYGALQGMVTMEDILEEIVGNIDDEHDQPQTQLAKRKDGSLEVDGALSIRDLNREMGWRLPDEEASSVAGLVIHEARAIPDVGQVFEFYSFRFQIISRQRNQIMRLRITPIK